MEATLNVEPARNVESSRPYQHRRSGGNERTRRRPPRARAQRSLSQADVGLRVTERSPEGCAPLLAAAIHRIIQESRVRVDAEAANATAADQEDRHVSADSIQHVVVGAAARRLDEIAVPSTIRRFESTSSLDDMQPLSPQGVNNARTPSMRKFDSPLVGGADSPRLVKVAQGSVPVAPRGLIPPTKGENKMKLNTHKLKPIPAGGPSLSGAASPPCDIAPRPIADFSRCNHNKQLWRIQLEEEVRKLIILVTRQIDLGESAPIVFTAAMVYLRRLTELSACEFFVIDRQNYYRLCLVAIMMATKVYVSSTCASTCASPPSRRYPFRS